jgi:hypothetical protein
VGAFGVLLGGPKHQRKGSPSISIYIDRYMGKRVPINQVYSVTYGASKNATTQWEGIKRPQLRSGRV